MRPLSVASTLLLAVALLLTALPAGAGVLPPGGTFRDDDGNVHEGNIEAIAAADITKGCNPPTNDLYCPASTVTRGQMAAFLARTLSLPAPSDDYFVDDGLSIFQTDINKLYESGITKGCNPPDNDRFCPEDPVTRQQMAAFLVRAYGYSDPGAGDWFTDDDGSIFEGDIDRLRVAGVTLGCNPPANTLFCPTQGVRRDEMASFLSRAEGLTPMVPPPRPEAALETFLTGLTGPIWLTAPPGDDRIFIVEKRGRILVYKDGSLLAKPFLDIAADTSTGSEQGLLSMAFHPEYATNGKFYVYQTRGSGNGTSHIDEYTVSGAPDVADAASRASVLAIAQPYPNHNGGQIEFGPDGYLWIGLGDGGSGGDPDDNGQDIATLFGSILRIDVDSGKPYASPSDNPFVGKTGRDEIWAYGLRNPWRWTIHDGYVYIADVGQNAREEIDVIPLDQPGANFGWCLREGLIDYSPGNRPHCDDPPSSPLVDPVLDFSHSAGNCSITGGRVYDGLELPDLVGHYFYVDLCLGRLNSFELVGGTVTDQKDWTSEFGLLGGVWSFGSDDAGNLYILQGGGTIMRLTAA